MAVTIHIAQEPVDIYNVYRPPRPLRELDLGEISFIAEDHPIYLGGDFNAHHPYINDPNTSQFNNSNPTGRHIIESLSSYPSLNLVQSNTATHVRGSLDLEFVSYFLREHTITNIHKHLSSDHYALISEITLPRLASSPHSPKWKTVQIDGSAKSVDELEEDLRAAITEATETTFSKTRPHNKTQSDHWYYNERVAKLHHRIHITRKNLHKHPSENNLALYRDTLRLVKKELLNIRSTHWLEWCPEINPHTSLKDIWSHLRKATGSYRSPRIQALQNPKAEADNLVTQFATCSSTQNLLELIQDALDISYPLKMAIVDKAKEEQNVTDTPITLTELKQVLSKHKSTAPGQGGITYEMINHMGQ